MEACTGCSLDREIKTTVEFPDGYAVLVSQKVSETAQMLFHRVQETHSYCFISTELPIKRCDSYNLLISFNKEN